MSDDDAPTESELEQIERQHSAILDADEALIALGEHLADCRRLALARLPKDATDRIWPDAWRWLCKPKELYVIRKMPFEKWGSLIIPDTAQEEVHQGFIFTTGIECFAFGFDPLGLIGREIYWSQYSGVPLSKHYMDRRFDSKLLQIGINEILGIRAFPELPEENRGDS